MRKKYRKEVEQFANDIWEDLNVVLLEYQKKLGIKYGDSDLTLDDAVDNMLAVLDNQLTIKELYEEPSHRWGLSGLNR